MVTIFNKFMRFPLEVDLRLVNQDTALEINKDYNHAYNHIDMNIEETYLFRFWRHGLIIPEPERMPTNTYITSTMLL